MKLLVGRAMNFVTNCVFVNYDNMADLCANAKI